MKARFPTGWACCVLALAALAAPRPRPAEWAQPVLGSSLDNFFQVSPDLYRSEQLGAGDVADLKTLGIRSLLSLRDNRDDATIKGVRELQLLRVPMAAGTVTRDQLLQALRLIRDAPKPLLIHCYHGSDRTGVVVAAYRIVFQRWSKERAIDEFKNGGFGYHAGLYRNLETLLETVDGETCRAELDLR